MPQLVQEAVDLRGVGLENDRERRIAFEAATVTRGIDFRPTWELARTGQLDGLRRRLGELRR